MDLKDVKELVDKFDDSTLTEFDLRKGDFEMYLSKNEAYGRVPVLQQQAAPVAAPVAPVAVAEPVATPAAPAPVAEAPVEAEGELVVSPIVGVVYLKPAPDQDPFVKVGDQIGKDDTVCIVEAMKMMNEVPSGFDGVVTEIIAENEQVVGIGDPLFRIK
jgi:acetyl-CoA carboxylase biotin carboxyl carrier protein